MVLFVNFPSYIGVSHITIARLLMPPSFGAVLLNIVLSGAIASLMETGELLDRTVHVLDHVVGDPRCETEPVTTPPLRMEVQPVLVVTKT